MTAIKPYLYTGEGSAIDSYNNPKKQLKTIVIGNQSKSNWGLFDNNNKQHRTILSQLRTLQHVVPSEKWGEVPDIKWLSEFLKSDRSPVNKPLKKMDEKELSKMISCFDSMINKNYK